MVTGVISERTNLGESSHPVVVKIQKKELQTRGVQPAHQLHFSVGSSADQLHPLKVVQLRLQLPELPGRLLICRRQSRGGGQALLIVNVLKVSSQRSAGSYLLSWRRLSCTVQGCKYLGDVQLRRFLFIYLYSI